MSAFPAARVGDDAEHGLLLEGRDGADDENSGSAVAGDGAENQMVSGGRDLGFTDRHLRRIRERYQEFGYDGLLDGRRSQPSAKRVPLATVEMVLGLYRERYFDLNVRHFHEKLNIEHQIHLSYSWVKAAPPDVERFPLLSRTARPQFGMHADLSR